MFAKFRNLFSTRTAASNVRSSGQSLIEVTFAAAVVGLVLVAILSTVIATIRQARIALEQTQATQYGQAAVEWLRSTRDQQGWGAWYSELADRGATQTYCWPTLPNTFDAWLAQSTGACNENETIPPDSEFQRQIQLQIGGGPVEEVTITITITRPGQGGEVINTFTTTLTNWED